MGYTVEQMADLVALTLSNYGKMAWTDLTTDLQEFHALPQILKKEKVQFDGGKSITKEVQVDHGHSTKPVKLYEVDQSNVNDQMNSITVGWRHVTSNMSFDVREKAINEGPTKIVDLIAVRRHGMMVSLAEEMESYFWTIAATDDGITPFGLKYWCTKHVTGSSLTGGGFNGGAVFSGAVYPGGLNHPRWCNWTAKYTAVTKADLIALLRRAYRKCDFKAPIPHRSYDQGASRYVLYCGLPTLEALETLGEGQNENLGRDLASMDGEMVFRGRPIRWVPKLDATAADIADAPVYLVDWAVFYPVFLRGFYLNESEPYACKPVQHTVVRVDLDCTYNTLCHDRRRLAVIAKTATD